jgi:predicted XRE-type DNA-binding protein
VYREHVLCQIQPNTCIEDTPEETENMKLRSTSKTHITRTGMGQAQAAKFFGVTQPRISDLMRGKSTSSAWMPW